MVKAPFHLPKASQVLFTFLSFSGEGAFVFLVSLLILLKIFYLMLQNYIIIFKLPNF